MKKKHMRTLLLILFAILLSFLESKGVINLDKANFVKDGDKIFVSRVIDGDTIELNTGEKLRYIGIDTPEVNYGKSSECFALEAKEFNKKLIEKKEIELEKDITNKDKFGRLLRYVYVENESTTSAIFVNEHLVRQGYAIVSTYPPDIKYIEDLLSAQREARENNRGLWGKCN